ncbi:MAG: hypothetical protein K1W34_13995 [Lachnospiraceae bacterium]
MSVQTGICRFCGQSVMVEHEKKLTAPQLEEEATMRCGCEGALQYQESANRRETAKERVKELFGDEARDYRQPEAVQTILLNIVDAVCDKKNKE